MEKSHNQKEFKKVISEQLLSSDYMNILLGMIVFLQLYGETMQNKLLMSLKPLPIILLIIKSLYFIQCKRLITYGLIFSLMGDIFLMAKSFTLFKIGTICFIITHIFYISAFLQDFRTKIEISKNKKHLSNLAIMSVCIFLIMNNIVLWNQLPDKVIFPIYGLILSAMVISSILRYNQMHNYQYIICVIGTFSFMISDSLIAHTKLDSLKINYSGTLIMGLYYFGQYLILKGVSIQKSHKNLT